MNMNGMNFESKRQELAGRLVAREVYYCVSSLVSTLSALAQNCDSRVLRDECLDWEEDILPLLEWIDYEEALRQHVMENADLDDMEAMVEECGYWDDFIEEKINPTFAKVPSNLADKLCVECHMAIQGCAFEDGTPERDEEVREATEDYCELHNQNANYCGEEYDEEFGTGRCDCCGSYLAGRRFTYEDPDEMETQDLEAWLDADIHRWDDIRSKVADFLIENGDVKELCLGYDVDVDDYRNDIYEHWIVSTHLASMLESRGEVVGELCGLTIWGRCCTGQSICLDRVVQQCAIEIWKEEWDEFIKQQEK